MSANELTNVLRAFGRRRPFRPYLIELNSGDRILVSHPETVIRVGELFVYHAPDHADRVFKASAVSQVLSRPS